MRFGHVAGDPLLDLINTVDWRLGGSTRTERLVVFEDVVDWCAESGLITVEEDAELRELASRDEGRAERERRRVVEAREFAHAVLFANDPVAAAGLASGYREAIGAADLVRDGDRWVWRDRQFGLRVPRDRIVRGLVALTQRDDLDRLHRCEDARCGWVYLDTSPRRNRRWCDTKDCGDRNRARAYYARQKAKENRP